MTAFLLGLDLCFLLGAGDQAGEEDSPPASEFAPQPRGHAPLRFSGGDPGAILVRTLHTIMVGQGAN